MKKVQTSSAFSTAEPDSTGLYRLVWRWHFYAALVVAPVLLVSAVTGALYVFKPELSDWLYGDLVFVEPGKSRLSYEEQLTAAQSAAGGLEIEGLILSADPRRSTQFVAHVHPDGDANPNQQHRVFFVDPYTGQVLGTHILEETVPGVVLRIHRTLLAGRVGRVMVELAACWGLVLLFTGFYLWWPRQQRAVRRGVWWPRLRGKPYAILRDLHAVTGLYTLVFAAIILASGLLFSQVWGTGYRMASTQAGQSIGPVFAPANVASPADGRVCPLDAAIAVVLERSRPGDTIVFQFAVDATHTHIAFLMRGEDPETLRVVKVNPFGGQVVSITDAGDFPPMARVMALGLSLHQGKTFGLASRLVAVATCLALAGMVVSGLWMWWQRRPVAGTGFPRRPEVRVPYWLRCVILLLGLLLPVLGVSLLIVLLGERIIGRFKRWRLAIRTSNRPEPGL